MAPHLELHVHIGCLLDQHVMQIVHDLRVQAPARCRVLGCCQLWVLKGVANMKGGG